MKLRLFLVLVLMCVSVILMMPKAQAINTLTDKKWDDFATPEAQEKIKEDAVKKHKAQVKNCQREEVLNGSTKTRSELKQHCEEKISRIESETLQALFRTGEI